MSGFMKPGRNFYPRPPRGGRHFQCVFQFGVILFLSTPSARRATRWGHDHIGGHLHFYPRPPRGGRHEVDKYPGASKKISIHALREEGDARRRPHQRPAGGISIHALREEGDCLRTDDTRPQMDFYPRPPRGGRLPVVRSRPGDLRISIHALREEGDAPCRHPADRPSNFYPRPPRGGRRLVEVPGRLCGLFLSTPSARRATWPRLLTTASE